MIKQLLFVFVLFVGAVACQPQSPPRVANVPQPDPTQTTLSQPSPTPRPTPLLSVKDSINQYTHPSTRFSINYPLSWQIAERPDGVTFVAPSDLGGYSVFLVEVTEQLSARQIQQYLTQFVLENLIDTPAQTEILQEEVDPSRGEALVRLQTVDDILGPTLTELRGFQRGNIIFIQMTTAIEAQWALSREALQMLTDSFVVLDTKPAHTPTPGPDAPPVWVLIGPTTHDFGFVYPSDWQILVQSERAVVVQMPDNPIQFAAQTYTTRRGDGKQGLAEQAVQSHLTDLAQQFGTIETSEIVDYPLDKFSGVNADFVYRMDDGTQMAGTIIAANDRTQIYQILFSAPITNYQFALDWFNPMYQSFRALAEE